MASWWRKQWPTVLGLGLITLVGLMLRLLAWRWHEFRPLGGDEREYLNLAIHLAQGKGYYDLQFMRPPLFPLGLAVLVWLFDGDLQWLRMGNVLVSTATVPLVFWWTRTLLPEQRSARVPLLAAALTACSYTLALNATELLTETVTLAGLILALICLLRAAHSANWRAAALAGVMIGLVCLVRSVALPLVPLGALWLWRGTGSKARGRPALVLLLAALLTIAPWTVRNAITYGGLILIDTTGPENLWLDNDPAGREAVKAQLYALGNDRVARSKLATSQGVARLLQQPGWVAAKSWREFRRFWALEHSDDMLDRPAIWVRPAEVWLRLLLGDGLWLIVLLAGIVGLGLLPMARPLRMLLAAWALYTVFTGVLFHVEYRYRLPLYLVLLPCAAWFLDGFWAWRRPHLLRQPRVVAAGALGLMVLALTLSFRGYPGEAIRLGRKHLFLTQAEESLALWVDPLPADLADTSSNIGVYKAQSQAAKALQLDPRSVTARVLLARVDLALKQPDRALANLDAAISQLPAHPYAHLLRGDLLRARGNMAAARRDLAFETDSSEDLQRWAQLRFTQTPLSTTLDLGGGLDLGFIGGLYPAEADGSRWTSAAAYVLLAPPEAAREIVLRAAAQRPSGVALPAVEVELNGRVVGTYPVPAAWGEITLMLPTDIAPTAPLIISMRPTTTFVPHATDPSNPDGRELGIRLDWVRLK